MNKMTKKIKKKGCQFWRHFSEIRTHSYNLYRQQVRQKGERVLQ
jgi:hypothetical protein